MTGDAKTFILAELKEKPEQTLPQLVKTARTQGLTEGRTRSAAQGMLEKGELLLDKSMKLRVGASQGQQ